MIQLYVSYGCDKESEAKQLFKFLPGIISSVRQIVDSRSGRIQLEIFLVHNLELKSSFMI
jgi:hypothetical protein